MNQDEKELNELFGSLPDLPDDEHWESIRQRLYGYTDIAPLPELPLPVKRNRIMTLKELDALIRQFFRMGSESEWE